MCRITVPNWLCTHRENRNENQQKKTYSSFPIQFRHWKSPNDSESYGSLKSYLAIFACVFLTFSKLAGQMIMTTKKTFSCSFGSILMNSSNEHDINYHIHNYFMVTIIHNYAIKLLPTFSLSPSLPSFRLVGWCVRWVIALINCACVPAKLHNPFNIIGSTT